MYLEEIKGGKKKNDLKVFATYFTVLHSKRLSTQTLKE